MLPDCGVANNCNIRGKVEVQKHRHIRRIVPEAVLFPLITADCNLSATSIFLLIYTNSIDILPFYGLPFIHVHNYVAWTNRFVPLSKQ